MHYVDLSPYSYLGAKDKSLNVGWLAHGRPFPRSKPAPELVVALRDLVIHPVNLCRGWHTCEFCNPKLTQPQRGNGEIRVTHKDGTLFAAPVLIAHYVESHLYDPPAKFIEAVLMVEEDRRFGQPHYGH